MKPGWLYGWKDIACYIGCDVTTIKRYEKIYPIPVYRRFDRKPMVNIDEINGWLKKDKNQQKITNLPQK